MKISILFFCFVLAGCQSTVLNLDETEDMLYTSNLSTEPGLKLKGMITQGVVSINTNMVGEVRSGYLLSMLAGYGNHQMVSLLLARSIQARKKINRAVYLDTLETAFLQNQIEITGALLDYARATNLALSPKEFSNIVGGAGQRPGIPDTSFVLLKEYMSEMNRKMNHICIEEITSLHLDKPAIHCQIHPMTLSRIIVSSEPTVYCVIRRDYLIWTKNVLEGCASRKPMACWPPQAQNR